MLADLNATPRERMLAEAVRDIADEARAGVLGAQVKCDLESARADTAEAECDDLRAKLRDETKRADQADADVEAAERKLDEADRMLSDAVGLLRGRADAAGWCERWRAWAAERAAES